MTAVDDELAREATGVGDSHPRFAVARVTHERHEPDDCRGTPSTAAASSS